MRRYIISLMFMVSPLAIFAQTEMPASSAPAAVQDNPAATPEMAPEMLPEAQRIEAECRDWAVQDGVPEDELATYVKECIEDRAAQE